MSWIKEKISSGTVGLLKRLQPNELPSLAPQVVPCIGNIQGVRFFLGTKMGLLYYDGIRLWRLFEGRVYGITKWKSRWYTTWNHRVTLGDKPLGTNSTIISFRFDDEQVIDLKLEVAVLDEEIHQIDAWKGRLYVTDTASNRVIAYRIHDERLEEQKSYYPNGRLNKKKQSPNYAHINSVFHHGKKIYLMYHNRTKYTGKCSQIAVLDNKWEVVQVIDTPADSAHNVYVHNESVFCCDSRNGRLLKGKDVLWQCSQYLRGLAVSEQFWLIGGSEFAKRDERDATDGCVHRWEPSEGCATASIRIPKSGSVYEVRLVGRPDYAMSSFL